MDPPPPRAPWSLRVWGWVIIASSVLSLISFSLRMLSSAGSSSSTPPAAVGVVVSLVTIATGIGFVTGMRWSWFTGFVLAVGGLVFGGWYLLDVEGGTLQTRSVLAVLWLGPPLLLLACLAMPSSVRWALGAPPAWAMASSIPPPPVDTTRRRSVLLPVVTIVGAAAIVGAWFLWGRGLGSVPDEAAGFRLYRSWTVNGMPSIGPPVWTQEDLVVLRHQFAYYVDGARSAQVTILYDDHTSEFSHEVLLRAAGIGIVATEANPEGRLGDVSAKSIDGLRYTCVRTTVAMGCIWTEPSMTSWTLSNGGLSVDRIRTLAREIHDAVV